MTQDRDQRSRTSPAPMPPSDAAGKVRGSQAGSSAAAQAAWVKRAYGLMAVLLLGFLAFKLIGGHDAQADPLDNLGVPGFELLGSLLCLARAALPGTSRGTRLRILLLGTSLLSWSLGDVVVELAERAGQDGTPTLAHAFYLAFYPISYVAVMLLMRGQVRRFGVESWLDGAIVGLGAAAICAAFLFHGIEQAAGGSGATVASNLALPVGDLLLLGLVAGGTAVLPGRNRLPWLLLALGYAVNTVGDTANLFASSIGATRIGSTADAVAWPASIMLISASVWVSSRPAGNPIRPAEPGFILPGAAAGAVVAMLLTGSFVHVSRAALALAATTMVVAGVRAGLSILRLRAITNERHREAVTDQLTGLANRRALHELLERLCDGAQERDGQLRPAALLFVDLNRFKEVNDSFGHAVGDQLLRQISRRLTDALTDATLVARLGGDEFVVALVDAGSEQGVLLAERISARLQEPFQLGSVRSSVGASIGIAVSADAGGDPHALVRCADLAMYRAKLAGQPFAVYSPQLDASESRLALAQELREAIERRRLELHYQPQIELHSGRVAAVEALVRWRHPAHGRLAPPEFLPLAEEAELMPALSALVLDMALEQCSRWRRDGHGLTVSVNLSSAPLLDPELPRTIALGLERHRLSAAALVVEITETTAITDFTGAREAIRALRELGVEVSIDDFGAGFTSLAHLSNLAVCELKLDRSFVRGLADGDEERNRTLVGSTVALAHSLGLRVVAEGVEDHASLQLLSAIGCDRAQGHLLGRPLPAPEVELDGVAALTRS